MVVIDLWRAGDVGDGEVVGIVIVDGLGGVLNRDGERARGQNLCVL